MIQAIRLLTPSGATLANFPRTRAGKFSTTDGAVDLVDLLGHIAESMMQAEVEVAAADEGAPAARLPLFEAPGGAVLPDAARLILAERAPEEVRRAAVLVELRAAVCVADAYARSAAEPIPSQEALL